VPPRGEAKDVAYGRRKTSVARANAHVRGAEEGCGVKEPPPRGEVLIELMLP
jgi:hypothetical protein